MVKEGPTIFGYDWPMILFIYLLLGGYEGACNAISSWIEDGKMVYNHHRCLRGPLLPLLLDGGAHVVVMLIEQLVTFMTPASKVVGTLG